MLESDSAQLDDTFSRDVIDVWRHLKQRQRQHAKASE